MTTSPPTLEFVKVAHRYGETPSVADISFSVTQREVVSLLGPSGCGKSTILRLAAGLEQPEAGEIKLNGKLIANSQTMTRPEERGIGLVFQDYALFPHMTTFDNVLFALNSPRYRHIPDAEKRERVIGALEKTDLTNCADMMPHRLSGGQQQRVALARALAPNPKLILLDEPFSGLDIRLKERIRDDMLHLLHDLGTAVLIVTHDSDEAMFMSDRIIVMKDGGIIQTGAPVDVFCHPESAFVAEFFGEVNIIGAKTVRDEVVATPFGDYRAEGIVAGSEVSMIIRNDGLIVEPKDGEPKAEVVESIMLGRYSVIHLALAREGEPPLHLHARIPGMHWFEEGTKVSLRLDESQIFIFPKAGGI